MDYFWGCKILILAKSYQFAQILISFAQILAKFCPNLTKFAQFFPKQNLLGGAVTSPAPTALFGGKYKFFP